MHEFYLHAALYELSINYIRGASFLFNVSTSIAISISPTSVFCAYGTTKFFSSFINEIVFRWFSVEFFLVFHLDNLDEFKTLHFLEQLTAHLCGTSGDDDAGLFECIDLVLSAALAARDDGTSVTHTTTGWS